MGKLVVALLLLVLGVAAVKLGRHLAAGLRDERDRRLTTLGGRLLGVGCFVIVALILTLSVFVVIPAGHVGVPVLFGQVQPRALAEGLNVILPWYNVVSMTTQVQKFGAKFDAASKDLQAVHVDMVINYRLLPARAPDVYRTVGIGYADVIIVPAEQEVLKAHTALYVASDILHQRPKLKAEIQGDLTAWLARYGIELKEAALANIRFDQNYERAIEAKQIEEQKAEQKRYELIQAQRQAEIVAAKAKGEADQARESAKGEADALRFKGQAQAEYNRQVAASLTPVLIQREYLAKWNGTLPQYMLGGGASVLIGLPHDGAPKKD